MGGTSTEGTSRRERTVTRAKHHRKDMPLAEVRLWHALRGRRDDGLKFRRQHPEPPYIIDFVERGAKLAIEVDGATHGEDHEVSYDARRTEYLQSKGWTVIRVGNDEVYEQLSSVVAHIYEAAHGLKRGHADAGQPPIDPPMPDGMSGPLVSFPLGAGGEKAFVGNVLSEGEGL